ncbi:MAG: diaminopimelate epimerase, partial [Bacteroidales bacterium]
VGADGLILLEKGTSDYDFSMRYFNADGKEASLCGNGSRCIVAFADFLGIIGLKSTFKAYDGLHAATILEHWESQWLITIQMNDVNLLQPYRDGYFVDTGSPHFVTFFEEINSLDICVLGKKLRYDARFVEGTNVNFVMPYEGGICVRTFERGVEDETLSCGTGVTAAAIVWAQNQHFPNGIYMVPVHTQGGDFTIRFHKNGDHYSDIYLTGPVVHTFSGQFYIHN